MISVNIIIGNNSGSNSGNNSIMNIIILCVPFLWSFTLLSFYPEPPSLSIHPSPLPLAVPGQTFNIECEASGFAPLSLELSWHFKGTDGKSKPLGSGSVTGHRQAWDGTLSQSTRLELDTTTLDLGRGGEVTCVATHLGGTRRASVTLNMIGNMKELGC